MLTSPMRRRFVAASAAAVVAATLFIAPPAFAVDVIDGPWSDTALDAQERASLLVDVLTLDEKIDLLVQTGGEGLPQYGVPAIRGKDASNGVSNEGGSTALPVGLALASTWDTQLAEEYGAVSGRETREAGYNSAAAPSVDLARTPWNGRIWESLGEDPYLVGALGSQQTEGVQSEDIPAEVKHYTVYNAESRRGNVDVTVDERTLQEIYTRAWEPIITEANAASVMCSFNMVNSEYACGSDDLLNGILKDQLNFQGVVQTDFNAAHSFADYAAGLDTSGETLDFSGDNLRAAVAEGIVSEERVTDAARRVLWMMFEFGIIDNPPVGSFDVFQTAVISDSTLAAGQLVATQTGAEGTVLLKNDGSLPLDTSAIDSIAVIGADADYYIDGGGSAAVTTPTDVTTILDGITERAGADVTVTYAEGTDPVGLAGTLPGPAAIPSDVLQNVHATYRQGIDNTAGSIYLERDEDQVNLRTGLSSDTENNTSQVPGIGYGGVLAPITVEWTGDLVVPASGTYALSLTGLGSAQLIVDGEQVLSLDTDEVATESVELTLDAEQSTSVEVLYTTDAENQFDGSLNDQPGAMLRLGWEAPEGVVSPMITEAAAVAADSDVAVVVARDYTGEAGDRASLSLPQDQDTLIEAVTAANPNTIVVSATGGAITMPWIDDVSGVIQAWYGGQVQGDSVAGILFGDVNPSGKLPITFPASDEQAVAAGTSNPFDYVDVLSPTVDYSTDGIQIGYRSYISEGLEPLFEFGYGLSYTEFAYGTDLAIPEVEATGDAGTATTATVSVTNTGDVAGDEIVQLYVGNLPTSIETADRALAGFARVSLAAGETKTVEIPIDRRSLQYWDSEADQWVMPEGQVEVSVGASSTDIRAEATMTVTAPPVEVALDGKSLTFTTADDTATVEYRWVRQTGNSWNEGQWKEYSKAITVGTGNLNKLDDGTLVLEYRVTRSDGTVGDVIAYPGA